MTGPGRRRGVTLALVGPAAGRICGPGGRWGSRSSGARVVLLRAVLLGAVVAIGLGGCVSIPSSGPVAVGDGRVDEPGTVFPLAYSPPADAEPVTLVQGFLAAAAAGLGDNYAVARQYLTAGARAEWAPDERVVVYSTTGPLEFRASEDGSQVSVTLPVVATVDGDGRYLESPPGARQDAVFDLVRDSTGQWRIAGLEDGVLMSEPIFESVYRAAPLYFLTPGRDQLVPETRWFPQRNTATYAVRELLEGPSPWLRDAVRTAFPEGTHLSLESVPVDADGIATVDLTAAVAAADGRDRALLKAQLEQVLQLPRIRAVEVTIAGVPMVEPPAAELGVDPSPGPDLRALVDGRVQVLDGGELVPAPDVGALGVADPHGLAWSADGDPTVVLSGPDTLVLAPEPDGAARVLLTGAALVEPSVDPVDWIWSGPSVSAGGLVALRSDGAEVDVEAPWLQDRAVRSLQVSRDGTRIAVVSAGGDGVTVDVAGVVRDDSGAPQRLGERQRVGAPLLDATDVVWVDESTLAVLGTSGTTTGPAVHLVPVSGQTQAMPPLPEEPAVALAAGRGERAVYAVTGTGSLWTLRGTSWVVAAEGVRSPTFPG